MIPRNDPMNWIYLNLATYRRSNSVLTIHDKFRQRIWSAKLLVPNYRTFISNKHKLFYIFYAASQFICTIPPLLPFHAQVVIAAQ